MQNTRQKKEKPSEKNQTAKNIKATISFLSSNHQ
jgi:hypothetical protein